MCNHNKRLFFPREKKWPQPIGKKCNCLFLCEISHKGEISLKFWFVAVILFRWCFVVVFRNVVRNREETEEEEEERQKKNPSINTERERERENDVFVVRGERRKETSSSEWCFFFLLCFLLLGKY